jgi:hypothetical protein
MKDGGVYFLHYKETLGTYCNECAEVLDKAFGVTLFDEITVECETCNSCGADLKINNELEIK